MASNEIVDVDETRYAFNRSGMMVKNNWFKSVNEWWQDGEKHQYISWYYFIEDGTAANGLKEVNGNTYYFNIAGCMVTDTIVQDENGDTYKCDENGHIIKNQWIETENRWFDEEYNEHVEIQRYYLGSDGKAVKGINKIDEKMYYFSECGIMQTDCVIDIDEGKYVLNENGIILTEQWYKHIVNIWYDEETNEQHVDSNMYFLGTDGKALNGLQEIDGKIYYFDDYRMVTNQSIIVDGITYEFDENGNGTIQND